MKTRSCSLVLAFLLIASILSGCVGFEINRPEPPKKNTVEESSFDYNSVPAYSGEAYVAVNNNTPFFRESEITDISFEEFSELDVLNRCGMVWASVGQDLMPSEERSSIGSIKPTGWQTVRYDGIVDGNYLYNRCHLIGFQLTGENANERNLITGTRYLNIDGMLPFENMIADYVKETDNHVMYRVTPVFEEDNLVASGVLLEGYSVEDEGEGICFCVFAYNVQPGVEIDYATGDSRLAEGTSAEGAGNISYIGNKNSQVFHRSDCSGLPAEQNRVYFDSRKAAVAEGYKACSRCNP